MLSFRRPSHSAEWLAQKEVGVQRRPQAYVLDAAPYLGEPEIARFRIRRYSQMHVRRLRLVQVLICVTMFSRNFRMERYKYLPGTVVFLMLASRVPCLRPVLRVRLIHVVSCHHLDSLARRSTAALSRKGTSFIHAQKVSPKRRAPSNIPQAAQVHFSKPSLQVGTEIQYPLLLHPQDASGFSGAV